MRGKDVLNFIYNNNNLIYSLPNAANSLKIYLVNSGYRYFCRKKFFQMKMIKDYLRPSISQEWLPNLK